MKLYRVQLLGEWAFVIAIDEVEAKRMYCEPFGFETDEVQAVVEYQMDVPMILPSGWQSEPKPVEIPLATLDVMEHNGRHSEP